MKIDFLLITSFFGKRESKKGRKIHVVYAIAMGQVCLQLKPDHTL
jgi:hypothetical protein